MFTSDYVGVDIQERNKAFAPFYWSRLMSRAVHLHFGGPV